MKKILITGSNGYIGRNLTKYLQSNLELYIVGLDRVDLIVNLGDQFLHQSLLDSHSISGEYDTVIHLAAFVQVGGGQKAPMDYYRNNIVGTINLLERVDYKNFIFASTCQAHGEHVYGMTKMIGENIIRQYCELNNKPYSIFRFGNVLGGDYLTNTDGLMYNLIKAKETGVFYLYGDDYRETTDGSAMRDYVHVNDVCYALSKAIEKPSCVPGSEVQPFYEYLGYDEPVTVKECIKTFKKVNNCDFEVVVKPRRAGDPATVYPVPVSPYMPVFGHSLEEMMKL